MDRKRFELSTPSMPWRCATVTLPARFCGPDRIRTDDLRNANAAHYQLCYRPESQSTYFTTKNLFRVKLLKERKRIFCCFTLSDFKMNVRTGCSTCQSNPTYNCTPSYHLLTGANINSFHMRI